MKNSVTGSLAGLVFVFTLIWLAQMIGVNATYGSFQNFEQAMAFARQAHWFYYTATYINVLILTVFNILLYGSLYGMLKGIHPEWAAAGLAFVPLYAILALFSYLSQLTVIPVLIGQLSEPRMQPAATLLLQHLLQMAPQSTLGLFDQFSYFLLGFPGIIYGLLMRKDRRLQTPGMLFAASGFFCMLIGPGIVGGIPELVGIPSMVGGVLSIVATGWLAVRLLRGEVRPVVLRKAS